MGGLFGDRLFYFTNLFSLHGKGDERALICFLHERKEGASTLSFQNRSPHFPLQPIIFSTRLEKGAEDEGLYLNS